jgi:hypothetical protein
MLTPEQKETILRKAGVAVPAFPSRNVAGQQQQQADGERILKQDAQVDGRHDPFEQWVRTIDALFVEYTAARAAKSLRDAEEIRRLAALRQPSDAGARGRSASD